jgi:hypothetical protein
VEGIQLGLIPGTQYWQNAASLEHGNLLILYADGISESTNEAGEELGDEGLMGWPGICRRKLSISCATSRRFQRRLSNF